MYPRYGDRRITGRAFHYPERRSGFDRRVPNDPLQVLRDRPYFLIAMLVALNCLSAVDWAMTMRAMALGAAEANTFLRMLIDANPLAAGVAKACIMLAVTLLIWRERRYRLVLATAIGALGAYGALMIYHVIGVATMVAH